MSTPGDNQLTVDHVRELLSELGVDELIEASHVAFLIEALLPDQVADKETGLLDAMSVALERLAMESRGELTERRRLFDAAFICRRGAPLAALDRRASILHHFCLCVDGLIGDRWAELGMLLREREPDSYLALPDELSWADELLLRVCRAFVLLCRKGSGWEDVRAAAAEVHCLRDLQRDREQLPEGAETRDRGEAARLILRYNLARIVDLVAEFTITGTPADAATQMRRHRSNIDAILDLGVERDPDVEHVADLIWRGAQALLTASIWTLARRGLGAKVDEFIQRLVGHQQSPVLELWPSQRGAISQSLLDPAKRAIVVEMPTSAGKTLLAEFAIVQALALYPQRTVAYIVPTRALVNQITRRLRRDIEPLGFPVEAAIPVFEIDPTEDELLRQDINVLVVTPEKLDLLIRTDHPVVAELSLIVADEAHNIGTDARGARLELLLATLRRERADARFLLLTPFVPNGEELALWLGGEGGADATISIDWKPSERVAALARWRKRRNGPQELKLRSVPSAHHVDITTEIDINLGDAGAIAIARGERGASKAAVSASTAMKLAERGGVLTLCRGRKTAETRAGEIDAVRIEHAHSAFADSVINFASAELGAEHPLARHLRKGVAFHHAGLSHDLRYLIELLIDGGDVDIVCGTTTLAQGVNFPIGSVIVETLDKPRGPRQGGSMPLSFSEFWNIAGRAGRAMRDRVGLVVFPVTDRAQEDAVREFLRASATDVASALIETLNDAMAAADKVDLGFVRNHETFAVFLQYLTHALRVGGADVAGAQLQDLLRSSLVYFQLESTDRRAADDLVRATARYLESIAGVDRGWLALADGTGFSLPSVGFLYNLQRERELHLDRAAAWSDAALFGADAQPLTDIIDVIGQIPELSLGHLEAGGFNPAIVAGVVSDWVGGRTVSEIAARRFGHVDLSNDDRLRMTSHYLHSKLVGQVPWGMGALQRVTLREADALAEVGHIPSLVFYGVRSREAALLRMAGVPRIAAEGLAGRWRAADKQTTTFPDVRRWVNELPLEAWNESVQDRDAVSGSDARAVWSALAGVE
jgi:replicative superfamily II helicase